MTSSVNQPKWPDRGPTKFAEFFDFLGVWSKFQSSVSCAALSQRINLTLQHGGIHLKLLMSSSSPKHCKRGEMEINLFVFGLAGGFFSLHKEPAVSTHYAKLAVGFPFNGQV